MKYMYLLFPLCKGYTIEKWEIIQENYTKDRGMTYIIKRSYESLISSRYHLLEIDEKYMAYHEYIIASFSPKCVLLKHIMNLNNIITELGEKLGNNYVEIIYSQIHQAKKELEKYL